MRKKIVSLLLLGAVMMPSFSAAAEPTNKLKIGGNEVNIEFTETQEREYSKIEDEINEKYDYKIKEIEERNKELVKQGKTVSNSDTDYYLSKGAKRIGYDDVYIKFTKDSTSRNQNAIKAEKFDYQGYLNELEKEKGKELVVETSSWLNLTLDVLYFGGDLIGATNYFQWKRPPFFAFTDGHGLSVSTEMTWLSDYPYDAWNAYETVFKPNTILKNKQGIVGKADIVLTYENTGQTLAFFTWANDGSRVGNVEGNYLHNQIGFGGIGIDITGKPNISLAGSTDSLSAICTVRRY